MISISAVSIPVSSARKGDWFQVYDLVILEKPADKFDNELRKLEGVKVDGLFSFNVAVCGVVVGLSCLL